MKLGRVIGSVVCTQKSPSLEGVKLLLVQPLDERLQEAGEPLVACDAVQAGPRELVMFEGGREAALGLAAASPSGWFNTSDATIMGIVDQRYAEEFS
jgi:ethanolamine utilization protein EutN